MFFIKGSDSRPNRPLTTSLLEFGYHGEGVTDDSVWIVKSHFPERLGYIKVAVKRIILLVRNPFDAIESYFHMGMTNTHNKRLTPDAFKLLQHIWPEFVQNEAEVWRKFHEWWIRAAAENGVPMLTVRYEDLLRDRMVRILL